MPHRLREFHRKGQIRGDLDWTPHQGEFKLIKLASGTGQTPPMTIEEYRRLHPKSDA